MQKLNQSLLTYLLLQLKKEKKRNNLAYSITVYTPNHFSIILQSRPAAVIDSDRSFPTLCS